MSDAPDSPTSSHNGTINQKSYVDPNADVQLASTDGRIFRVESYMLKAHSVYFRDVLAEIGIPESPMEIPASTKVLKLVLDLMHMKPAHSTLIFACREPLFKLIDVLASPSVAERALFSLHDVVDRDPWGIFCLASQRGNVALAKAALKALGEVEHVHKLKVDELTPKAVAPVSLPYLLGLFNAALSAGSIQDHDHHANNGHASGYGGGNGNGHDHPHLHHDHDHANGHHAHAGTNWKAIADKFTPVIG